MQINHKIKNIKDMNNDRNIDKNKLRLISKSNNQNKIRTELLNYLDKENKEYLKYTKDILFNHRRTKDIIKEYEIFQIKLENPTINSSIKYQVKNAKNQINDPNKLDNYQSNNDYNYEIPNNFRADLIQKNKISCSFRKLKSKTINPHFQKITSMNSLNDENNISYQIPFSLVANNNNNFNSINNNNINTNNTFIEKRKSFYQSLNRSSTLNCSASIIKILLTEEEKRAKKIEEGFEKLQKLARSLRILDNKKTFKSSNLARYDDLFDILEFKGMDKEKDIIHKKIKKNKNSNLNKIIEEDSHNSNKKINKFNKNNYDTNIQNNIKILDKDLKFSDDEKVTFDKENFLKLAKSTKNLNKNSKNRFKANNLYESNVKEKPKFTNIFDKIEKNGYLIKSASKDFNEKPNEEKLKIKSCKRKLSFLDEEREYISLEKQKKNEIPKNPFKLSEDKIISQKKSPPKSKNIFESGKKDINLKEEKKFSIKSSIFDNKKSLKDKKEDCIISLHKMSKISDGSNSSNEFNETEKQKILENFEIDEKLQENIIKNDEFNNIKKNKFIKYKLDTNSNNNNNINNYSSIYRNIYSSIGRNNYNSNYSSNFRYRSNSNNLKSNFDTNDNILEFKYDCSQASINSVISNNSMMFSNNYNLNSIIEYYSEIDYNSGLTNINKRKHKSQKIKQFCNYENYDQNNFKSAYRRSENEEYKSENFSKEKKKNRTNISESDFISDLSKSYNNISIITKSSISDLEI
jgi:hypothetical protein